MYASPPFDGLILTFLDRLAQGDSVLRAAFDPVATERLAFAAKAEGMSLEDARQLQIEISRQVFQNSYDVRSPEGARKFALLAHVTRAEAPLNADTVWRTSAPEINRIAIEVIAAHGGPIRLTEAAPDLETDALWITRGGRLPITALLQTRLERYDTPTADLYAERLGPATCHLGMSGLFPEPALYRFDTPAQARARYAALLTQLDTFGAWLDENAP